MAAGHDVTLFNRGRTNPNLFSAARHVQGDRAIDLGLLAGEWFEAVVDTSGYHPALVGAAASTIEHETYLFVSSVSAYADLSKPGVHEGSPLATLDGPVPESFDRDAGLYGPLKALCERAVAQVSPGALVVRPGLVVGPHDPTDRFTYWPVRAARGGTILGPGDPARRVQVIDARDLAAWMLSLIERKVRGVFNAVGPAQPLSMGQMIEACIAGTNASASVTWVDDRFLLDKGVQPWSDLPLWLTGPETAGMLDVDNAAAVAAGLSFRPPAETAHDTWEWDRTRPPGPRAAGLDAGREDALLAEWLAR